MKSFIVFLYYTLREHSDVNATPLKSIMNVENKDLVQEIRENTVSRRLNSYKLL